MVTPLDIARAFAAALDRDDFAAAQRFLAPGCRYELRGEVLVGPEAIVASYADASRRAHAAFDEVRWESEVVATASGARVRYTDVLRLRGREHRHRCAQELSVDAGLVARIVHVDLPGEKEALAAFIAAAPPTASDA